MSDFRGEVTHDLKCWPVPFRAVCSGDKKHEVRVNDRDFRVGDKVMLREWNPDTQKYTGQHCLTTITYMTQGGTWGLPENLCILSIKLEGWYMPHNDALADQ